eukprot:14589948-Heterocapsa_arctica.AAC.1
MRDAVVLFLRARRAEPVRTPGDSSAPMEVDTIGKGKGRGKGKKGKGKDTSGSKTENPIRERECYFCGKKGHIVAECWAKQGKAGAKDKNGVVNSLENPVRQIVSLEELQKQLQMIQVGLSTRGSTPAMSAAPSVINLIEHKSELVIEHGFIFMISSRSTCQMTQHRVGSPADLEVRLRR